MSSSREKFLILCLNDFPFLRSYCPIIQTRKHVDIYLWRGQRNTSHSHIWHPIYKVDLCGYDSSKKGNFLSTYTYSSKGVCCHKIYFQLANPALVIFFYQYVILGEGTAGPPSAEFMRHWLNCDNSRGDKIISPAFPQGSKRTPYLEFFPPFFAERKSFPPAQSHGRMCQLRLLRNSFIWKNRGT